MKVIVEKVTIILWTLSVVIVQVYTNWLEEQRLLESYWTKDVFLIEMIKEEGLVWTE